MPVDLSGLGLAVGHATDDAGGTGLTVIRGIDGPLRGGVAIFGRATGARELHTTSSAHVVRGRVDALLLSGGSAYGLDSAAGAMRWLEERGRGFPAGGGVVPIVPAAVIFDLAPVGRFDARPTPAMAYAAMEGASTTDIAEGSVGAGTGATVGKIAGPRNAMKGGFGCATIRAGDIRVSAFAVVNALGDVRDAQGRILAGARAREGGFIDTSRLLTSGVASGPNAFDDLALQNTTLAVVVSNRPLGAAALTQLAHAAGAALFRRITPAGSTYDGDIIFALCPEKEAVYVADPMTIEAIAVTALEEAIERGVRTARGRDGVPGLADGDHGR